jgi:hypothetical protein
MVILGALCARFGIFWDVKRLGESIGVLCLISGGVALVDINSEKYRTDHLEVFN